MFTSNSLMRRAHSRRVIGFDGVRMTQINQYGHGDVKKSLS